MTIFGKVEDLLNFHFDPEGFSKKGLLTITPKTIDHLQKICMEMETKISKTDSVSQGNYDPEVYYFRFMENADKPISYLRDAFPTQLDIRRLAHILSYQPRIHSREPILLSNFLEKSLQLIEERWSALMISPILEGILHYWNHLFINKKNRICNLLIQKIQDPSVKLNFVKKYNNPSYYHQDKSGSSHYFSFYYGPLYLADKIAKAEKGIDYIYQIDPFKVSMNGFEFLAEYIWWYTKAMAYYKKLETQHESILNRLRDFHCPYTTKKSLPLIVIYADETIHEHEKDPIYRRTIDLLGDPADESKWTPLPNSDQETIENLQKAREIISTWLTGQFIDIFFDKLARMTNNFDPNRKKFWKLYLSQISYFKIFGSSAHLDLLYNDERIRKLVPCRFGILDGQQECAFCFTIKDKLFIEFVNKGNALYVYKSNTTYLPKISLERMHVNDLKSDVLKNDSTLLIVKGKPEGRLLHHNDWENKLNRWFRNQMGITVPGADYSYRKHR